MDGQTLRSLFASSFIPTSLFVFYAPVDKCGEEFIFHEYHAYKGIFPYFHQSSILLSPEL